MTGAAVMGADVTGADETGAGVTGADEGAEVTGDEVANVVVTVAPVLTFGTMKKNLGYVTRSKSMFKAQK